jgi:hypothetical protein
VLLVTTTCYYLLSVTETHIDLIQHHLLADFLYCYYLPSLVDQVEMLLMLRTTMLRATANLRELCSGLSKDLTVCQENEYGGTTVVQLRAELLE